MTAVDRPDSGQNGHEHAPGISFRRTINLAISGVAIIALAGLLGYVPGLRLLGSIRPDYIPMAPSTAVCYLIFSAALFLRSRKFLQGITLIAVTMLVILGTVFCLLEFAEFFVGIDLNFSDMLFPSIGMVGNIPVGRMSPATAATFAIAGLSTILLMLRSRSSRSIRQLRNWASFLGVLTLLVGATVLLGYLYGTPLMYGSGRVPMAATTALAFLFMGVALVASTGSESFLMRRVSGDSTSAVLSRVFIPLVISVVILQSLVSRYISSSFTVNEAFIKAFFVITIGMITAAVVDCVASSTGGNIDEVNRKLRLALKNLENSEEHHRTILQTAMDGIWLVSMDGRLLEVNNAYCRMSGYSKRELLSMRILDLEVNGTDSETTATFSKIMSQGEDRFESRHRRKDGSDYYVEVSAKYRPINGGQFVAFIRDITERRQVESELHKSENHFRTLVNSIPDLIWLKDADGVYLSCNAMFERFFGAKEADIIGKTDYDFVNSELADFFREHDRRAMEADRPSSNEEWVTFADDGHRALLYTTKMPMHDVEGKLIGVLGVGRDITELKQAEETVRESESRLRYALEGTNDGLWDVQFKSGRTYLSPRGCEILGYGEDEIKDVIEVWSELVHPDDLKITEERLQAHIDGSATIFEVEQRLRTKSGGWKWIHTRGKVVERDMDGAPLRITGTHSDITDKKILESQLHQAQKMESVGLLAGGVAHDFNNMLGVIIGYAELALMQMEPSQPIYANLCEIRSAAERSADLTRQLLAFARKQTIAPKVINLNETVSGMLKMLQRLIGEHINLNWHPAPEIWLVKVDPSQIDQMLANLCVNARDAITNVGIITIETGNRSFDANYCATHTYVEPGEYVRLVVSDNGIGMDKETVAHIFEPFFTTKGVGEGTGLGLATVYGIIKQNNGFINVYSEPGHGTTFTIYLPRHVGESGKALKEGETEPFPRGNETILLVEDEPAILKMATMILSTQGYTVLAANSPGEATLLACNHTSEIHLLMTDVVMPEMHGRDLAINLQALNPHMKCLFMSGYTANVIGQLGVLEEGVHFIQKPFSLPDLTAKVREVLDGKNG